MGSAISLAASGVTMQSGGASKLQQNAANKQIFTKTGL